MYRLVVLMENGQSCLIFNIIKSHENLCDLKREV